MHLLHLLESVWYNYKIPLFLLVTLVTISFCAVNSLATSHLSAYLALLPPDVARVILRARLRMLDLKVNFKF